MNLSDPMPEDRSVPEAEIVGISDYPEFRLEKIIYYSRENLPVTANLYLPKTPGKHPGVIFLCGHSADGKAAAAYRSGAANLAIKGFATLIIDPISQGERWQFVGVPNISEVNGKCTREHNVLGKQLRLFGDYLRRQKWLLGLLGRSLTGIHRSLMKFAEKERRQGVKADKRERKK